MFGFTGGVSSAVLTQNIVHIRVNKRGRRGKGSKGRQCGRYLDLQEKSNYSPAVGRVPTSNNNNNKTVKAKDRQSQRLKLF